MLGAVPTHLFVVGGSPLPAIILLIVTGVVAWGRRERTMNIFAGDDKNTVLRRKQHGRNS